METLIEKVERILTISPIISKSEKTNSITLVMPLDLFLEIKNKLKELKD